MGLRFDADFHRSIVNELENTPIGSGGSRLLGGEHPEFARLEQEFSVFRGAESSLFFGSGYGANQAIISVLSRPSYAFFSDELNHASIIDGLKLAKQSECSRYIYRHCDYEHLEFLLRKSKANVNVIYTESIFSMDGDVSDLKVLSELADRFNGILVVDEAHSIGVRGSRGAGEVNAQGLSHDRLITMSTCGKALGCQGALVSGPSWFRDAMINTARSFIYTTAPSPIVAFAVRKAIEYIGRMDADREHLTELSRGVRKFLEELDLDVRGSKSQIVPIVVGSEKNALQFANKLNADMCFVKAIRPPTVPKGLCRVRLSLNSSLSGSDMMRIQGLIERVVHEK